MAEAHHHKQWTIANHNNPSTDRLIVVKDIDLKRGEASVRTEEYWYLRWWSLKKHRTTVIYNMRNLQTYVLAREGDTWLVVENIYAPPRESASRRKWA